MYVDQLRHFKKLALLEHLTRAAEELFISQSALSVSISRLEGELGVGLFDRVGRSIRLNRYGEAFLPEVEEALAHLDNGISAVKSLYANDQSSVRIITPTILGFPNLISDIEHACDSVNVLTCSCTLNTIIPKLLSGEADACIIALPLQHPQLEGCLLRRQRMGLAVANSHPLASHGSVTVREIAGESFAAFPPFTMQRYSFTSLFRDCGHPPRVTFESDNYYDILRAVARGQCVATHVFAIERNYSMQDITFLEISDADVEADLRLYWKRSQPGKELRPLTEKMLEAIRAHFAAESASSAQKAEMS